MSAKSTLFRYNPPVRRPVTVACAQVEPVVLDLEASLERLAVRTAEAAGDGAGLVVFPEAYLPAYPSSVWAKHLAGWADPAREGGVRAPGRAVGGDPRRRPPTGSARSRASTASGSSPA